MSEPVPEVGWRASEIEQELPQLQLVVARARLARAGAHRRSSPAGVQRQLRMLSDRFKGARAVGVRSEPVPAAYRVFYRQIGLDPEVAHTPMEAAVLERMLRGGFLSGNLLEDVLLIALIDTGVPVWAVDADAIDGDLGVRLSRAGEPLGRAPDAWSLPAGRLVVADGSAALGAAVRPARQGVRDEHAHARGGVVRGSGLGRAHAVRRGGPVDLQKRLGARGILRAAGRARW